MMEALCKRVSAGGRGHRPLAIRRAAAVVALCAGLAACAVATPRTDPCANSRSPVCGQDHPIPDRGEGAKGGR